MITTLDVNSNHLADLVASVNKVHDKISKMGGIIPILESYDDLFKRINTAKRMMQSFQPAVNVCCVNNLLSATGGDYIEALGVIKKIEKQVKIYDSEGRALLDAERRPLYAKTHSFCFMALSEISNCDVTINKKEELPQSITLPKGVSYITNSTDDGRLRITFLPDNSNSQNVTALTDDSNRTEAKVLIPKTLQSEKAKNILVFLVKNGVLDDNWQPSAELGKELLAILAYKLGEVLHINAKWKFFGGLWNKKPQNLRKNYNKVRDSGKYFEFNRTILKHIDKCQ